MKNLNRNPHSKAKILIADDDKMTLILLANIFKRDFEVYTTTKGIEVIELVKEFLPDLILLDISMPDLDGYKIAIKLKADPILKEIPIIFITGLEGVENEVLGLKIGAIDYIQKPINALTVDLRVRNHLELKKQRDILTKLSFLDGLTGCYNRRDFEQSFPSSWEECKKNSRPLTLMLIDLDYFKSYNDTYGHLQGDDCLKSVVKVSDAILRRPTDFLARYGGDEFIGLLYSDLSGGEVVANKIQELLASTNILHDCSPFGRVTLSIGVATSFPRFDKDPKVFLSLADKMVYRAKENGRNCIESELLSIDSLE